MSDCVHAIDRAAIEFPERIAFSNSSGEYLTYAQLRDWTNALAVSLASHEKLPHRAPVIVFGHKSPLMLVCILAAVKSGHAYVPVDTVYPANRVSDIVSQIGETVVLDTTASGLDWDTVCPGVDVWPIDRVEEACALGCSLEDVQALPQLGPDDTFYILFTSGSTGMPKGVEITTLYFDGFATWLDDQFAPGHDDPQPRVWFNRAPFSFDVSVADIVGGLPHGDALFALEAPHEASLKATFDALSRSGVTDWVSTPSFVDQCLADPSFNETLLPHLRRMLLAGEVLRHDTVAKAVERFPKLRVFNGYGPTEAGFVTICEIDGKMLSSTRSLPIGYAKPGIDLVVLDPSTLEPIDAGAPGELFLVGDTVGNGYWNRPEQTEAGFHSCPERYCRGTKSYRTGDECILDEDGLLYYHGRLDLQVKLHGYRIELGDVEACLCSLPQVAMCCVLPVKRDGAVVRLTAVVVPAPDCEKRGLALTHDIKAEVKSTLPAYMIPSTFKYIDEMPLNPNGKADRKALAALIGA